MKVPTQRLHAERIKKGLITLWLLGLLSAAGALFWYNDWIYQLPTPIPPGYKPVSIGKAVALNHFIKLDRTKPVHLHFYNPDCPCSRFNLPHFKSLVRAYSHRVNFAVVVMSTKAYTAEDIQEKINLNLPILFEKSIATLCGVYSTPQAVLLDVQNRLYYRGNYNRSRYCTDEKTNYAQMALIGLLRNDSRRKLDPLAVQSYGCSLPYCENDYSFSKNDHEFSARRIR